MRARRHPLVAVRLAASWAFATLFVAGFAGAGRAADALFSLLASTQVFPGFARLVAVGVTGSTAGLVAVLAATAVFGRFYCSTLCPLGLAQDAAIAAGRRLGTWRGGFRRNRPALRMAAFATAAFAMAAGATSLAAWLDPYSLSGRFVDYAARPAVQGVMSLASAASRAMGHYWRAAVGAFSPLAAAAATIPLLVALGAALWRGRAFCGTLCPVGSVLGLMNSFAQLRVRLDSGSCISCGSCAAVCKAHCIDSAARNLDASRCVSCFSCLSSCPTGALRYGSPEKSVASPDGIPDVSRRRFIGGTLAGSVAVAGAVIAAPAARLAIPAAPGAVPALPPGAVSVDLFLSRCTACGLCVSKCPSRVLRPSVTRLGLSGFLVPYLDYDASYCQYECTACLDLCPSGALARMPPADKKLVQMGTAALVRDKCIVITEKTPCGACAEHCPTGAVRMVATAGGLPEPVFDESICIGCGACHHICPAEPLKAITVSGKPAQGIAAAPRKNLFSADEGSKSGDAGPDGAGAGDFPF